jgi:choline dehydrogenase-like flavoprotein
MIDGYDCIIIGAGSAGCVIADPLSADGNAQVLLVEAGGPDTDPKIHDEQIGSTMALRAPGLSTDWGYVTEPQAALGDRGVPIARGKVLGGSSSVNAMTFVRGGRLDYDSWAAAGNQGWGYDDVLPAGRRSRPAGGDRLLHPHLGTQRRPDTRPADHAFRAQVHVAAV